MRRGHLERAFDDRAKPADVGFGGLNAQSKNKDDIADLQADISLSVM